MDKSLILKFIAMPMAIKIFTDDKESFSVSKMGPVYFDLIDSIMNGRKKKSAFSLYVCADV